jgi:hypothetical protein
MGALHLRRLCALILFAASAAQMALPAAHFRSVSCYVPAASSVGVQHSDSPDASRETTSLETRVAAVVSGADERPVLSRPALPDAAHDRDACPVCQSLLHTCPAAVTSVQTGPASVLEVPLLAAVPRPSPRAAHTGHPPRGPPLLPAFSFV